MHGSPICNAGLGLGLCNAVVHYSIDDGCCPRGQVSGKANALNDSTYFLSLQTDVYVNRGVKQNSKPIKHCIGMENTKSPAQRIC